VHDASGSGFDGSRRRRGNRHHRNDLGREGKTVLVTGATSGIGLEASSAGAACAW
jgi:NADPH:quinone reductase-like Zn-dependent oxidoreductase